MHVRGAQVERKDGLI